MTHCRPNLVPTDMNLDYCLDLLYFHLVRQTTSLPADRRHSRGVRSNMDQAHFSVLFRSKLQLTLIVDQG